MAEKPLAPIDKGLAAPSMLAYVTVSRFADHLPYYRLEHILARHGIPIARSTLGGWEGQVAEAMTRLTNRMTERTLGSRVLHTDDTPVDVLEPGRGKTRTGRFWVYVGDDDHPCPRRELHCGRRMRYTAEFGQPRSTFKRWVYRGRGECRYYRPPNQAR